MCKCDVKSTIMKVTGGFLYIFINPRTFVNHEEFNLILCQSIPQNAGISQVFLTNGAQTIPLNVKTGNYLRADQLRCRNCYPMVYGNNPVHASMEICLKRSCFDVINPSVVVTSVATADFDNAVVNGKPKKEKASEKLSEE